MAKFDIRDHNYGKGEASSSLDQALLDEFLSIVASIAVRLTKVDTRDKNGDDSIKREVNEQ
jgi:hypothetical protein